MGKNGERRSSAIAFFTASQSQIALQQPERTPGQRYAACASQDGAAALANTALTSHRFCCRFPDAQGHRQPHQSQGPAEAAMVLPGGSVALPAES